MYGIESYFARVNYDYDGRYLLSATARYDGSSRFGANNRFGFFPSASVGWRISEEGFLKGNRTVNDLKLRGSLGKTGQPADRQLRPRGVRWPSGPTTTDRAAWCRLATACPTPT